MNPSTADLLGAVEAVPGRPGRDPAQQQEHHPGRRAGRRPQRRRSCGSSAPGASPRASPRCWATTPRPPADDERRRRWPTLPSNVRGRRGHPGGARLHLRRRAHRRGRLPRHRPRRHPGGRRPALADAACGLLDALVADEHEIVTVIEGEGATAADTRQITEWLAEHRPGVAARGPPRRPAALPVPLRRRVGARRGRDRRAHHARRSCPRGRSPGSRGSAGARRTGWRRSGVENRRSTCSPTTRGATSTAPTRPASATWWWARRRWSSSRSTGCRCAGPAAAAQGAGDRRRQRRHRAAAGHVLQPGVAGAPAARRDRGRPVRQGRALQRPPADDQPRRRPHRQRAPAASCRSTRSPRRRACPPGRSATGWRRRCAGRRRGAWPTRCPTGCSTATTSSAGRGVRRHPRARVDGPQGGGPAPAGARRAAAGPARPGPAQAAHRAHDPGHRPAHRAGRCSTRSSTGCRSS